MVNAIKIKNPILKNFLKFSESLNKGNLIIKGKIGGEWGYVQNPIK